MIINFYQILLILAFLALFSFKKLNVEISAQSFSRDYTTLMRGLAILFVVLHHLGNYSGSVIFTPLGGIGVAMFLVISGYGLHESYQKNGLSNYWKNKFARVIIPMLIVEILSIIVNENDRKNFHDTLSHLFCIDRNWYVRYLFYWYFLFFVIVRFLKKRYEFALLFCGLVMLVILPEIEAEQSFSFVSGVFLSLYKKRIKLSRRQWTTISILLLLFGGVCLFAKQMPVIRAYSGTLIFVFLQMCLKLSLAWCVLMIGFIIFAKKIPTFFYLSGIMSYEIYLIHCKLLGIINSSTIIISFILFYALTYLGSFILYRFDLKIAKFFK